MNPAELDKILELARSFTDVGDRIKWLSEQFLGTAYMESTLIGNVNRPEELAVNLEAVDCFTFIDYIEAMRLSRSYGEFELNLKKVRYHSGAVTFGSRNHFFSDWAVYNLELVDDITKKVANGKAAVVKKMLNDRGDGTYFLEGIPVRSREISYIPSAALESALSGFKTGDYAGIYSPLPGLDVSHVGIVVKKAAGTLLRHASSRYRRVLDEDLFPYFSSMPGIVLLRPKEPGSA
jgi:N-acetylmuramoyl-L-alanine amidase-like